MTDIALANVMAVLNEYRRLHPNSAYQTNVADYSNVLSVAISRRRARGICPLVTHTRDAY